MQMHEFSHPQLLGLNINAGQQIKLHLRTDHYDKFRSYRKVRRVLCRELTHNVWGDHDNNFKTLNSQLNRGAPIRRNDAQVLGGTGSLPIDPNESAEERQRRVLAARMARFQKDGSESSLGS
ncbi:hypothetical protein BDZ89DRAFT_1092807 [Hymenopellis radicata]|nr:hypothetical protein BDZ89DRAFT_1092807 [Hymenopellis radicata]